MGRGRILRITLGFTVVLLGVAVVRLVVHGRWPFGDAVRVEPPRHEK